MKTYRSLLRPVSTFTLPADIGGWWYVEIPAEFSMNRRDLPVSTHRHGIFATERPLTPEEMKHFSIEEI